MLIYICRDNKYGERERERERGRLSNRSSGVGTVCFIAPEVGLYVNRCVDVYIYIDVDKYISIHVLMCSYIYIYVYIYTYKYVLVLFFVMFIYMG